MRRVLRCDDLNPGCTFEAWGYTDAQRRRKCQPLRPPNPTPKANMAVWVITVAVFLAILITGILLLFLFSQRNQIREALRTRKQRRMERRTLARVEVQLLSTHAILINEFALTENVSRYGARVVTKTQWQPDQDVTVKLLRKNLSDPARVAYCNRVREEEFAVGLKFSSPVTRWTL